MKIIIGTKTQNQQNKQAAQQLNELWKYAS